MIKRSELEPDHRWFKMEDGRMFGAHKKSCLFCKHNTDIFYDYTNGPYMFCCDLGLEDETRYALDYVKMSFEGKCPKWESDGTEDAEEKRMTVLILSDYACHADIVNGCVKYNITDKSGHLIAVMNDRERAKDYTRQLQQDYDRLQVQMHPERYG